TGGSSKLKLQAIISKFHTGRQQVVRGVMLQLMRDVGQVGAGRFDSGNDSEGLVDAQVAGVRLMTQGIEHEDLQAIQQRPASLGKAVHVCAIGHVADAKSKDVEAGVDERDRYDALALDGERLFGNLPKNQL